MLTMTQSVPPYWSVHDLPAPPPISTPSLTGRQPIAASIPDLRNRNNQSPHETMSTQHRGLPPPAAMGLHPQQGPPQNAPPPPSHHSQQQPMPPQAPPGPPPHSHHQRDSWNSQGSLPPPPQHWTTSDDSMRNWLNARAEEEKTKQEEERTRQEGLRLEQRKIEMDMLRASLGGGIPPPMVPLVFAGMGAGGVLPQAALDWAHQFIQSQTQPQHPQLLAPRPPTPESQREAAPQSQSQYQQPAGQAASSQAPAGYPSFAERARGQMISGVMNRPGASSNLSSAGSNTPQSGQGPPPSASASFQQHQPSGSQSGQQDQNPSIYFHHWQPPATQSSQGGPSSNRPASPPADPQRKRKATETHHQSRASTSHRGRSPQMFIQTDFGNPPTARKSHKRHKSDVSWYQTPRHGGPSSLERSRRSGTPGQDNSSASSRDRDTAEAGSKRPVSMFISRDSDMPSGEPSRRDSYPDTYQERAPMAPRARHEHDAHQRERDSVKPERI